MGMALMILVPLLSLISLVGFIWLCVVAFRRHPAWGLLVFFLSPITAIVFAIKHWHESKKPFLVYMASFVACMGVVAYVVSTVGLSMLALAQQSVPSDMAQPMGEPTSEQQAAEPPPSSPEQPAGPGVLDPEEEAELRRVQARLREMEGGQAGDAAVKNDETGVSIALDGSTGKVTVSDEKVPAVAGGAGGDDYLSSVVPPGFHSVPIGKASEYVGKKIRVTSRGGREIEGRLAEADRKILIVERELDSGTITFELAAAEVETLLVAYQ